MMKRPRSTRPVKTSAAESQWKRRDRRFFAEEKEAEEGGLQEEGDDTFHGERHADDAAGATGELTPIGAVLELHGDAGNNAEEKIDGEDFAPEARGDIILCLLVRIRDAESDRLQNDDQ